MVETVDQYIACLETEEQHKWTMTFVAASMNSVE